jgi:16S rRNA (uracil1498-N3)-methyltransferase
MESRHGVQVLRLGRGEELELLDGRGTRSQARVLVADRRALRVVVEAVMEERRSPRVVLMPALLKGKAFDFLVQKATELGVAEVAPVITARTVVRWQEGQRGSWEESVQRTAWEACKQCGNPWLPRWTAPRPLAEVLAGPGEGLRMAAMLGDGPRLPGDILDEVSGPVTGVTVMIGPEGDFTLAEADGIRDWGALALTLGPRVLRAETAALAALAVVQHELVRRGWG